MLYLSAALGIVIGIVAGLFGAGTSILTMLVFLHVVRLDHHTAAATSLVVVAWMSMIAIVPYARAGAVMWRTSAEIGLASIAGAFLGARVSRVMPARFFVLVFVLALVTAATAMLLRRRSPHDARAWPSRRRRPAVIAAGLLVGSVTGTVGLGGGFALVPILVLLAEAPMGAAVGTSLVVTVMNTAAGLAGHLPRPPVVWPLAIATASAASIGTLAGAKLGKRVTSAALHRIFAILLFVVAFGELAVCVARAP
jgi:uncharacterized membrane protein YfcA